jgi:hypothetical protein
VVEMRETLLGTHRMTCWLVDGGTVVDNGKAGTRWSRNSTTWTLRLFYVQQAPLAYRQHEAFACLVALAWVSTIEMAETCC